LTPKVKVGIETYQKIREQVLVLQDISPGSGEISFTEYAKYILRDGNNEEKREIVKVFGKHPYINNKEVCSAPIS